MKYSIDTSAILNGWRRYYPPDVFPSLWMRIASIIDSGALIASEEVLFELERQDDEVYAWALERRAMFRPIDEPIQIAVAGILRDHPRLVDTRRQRSGADPFVIALAKIENAGVVTSEKHSGVLSKPNIPDVCDALGIRCLDLLDLIREQGWVFKL